MSLGTEEAQAIDRLAEAIDHLAEQGGSSPYLLSGVPELLPVYLALAGMAFELQNHAAFMFTEPSIAEMVPPSLRRIVVEHYFRYNDTEAANLWLGKRS